MRAERASAEGGALRLDKIRVERDNLAESAAIYRSLIARGPHAAGSAPRDLSEL
jgi:hypothetical protein